MEETVSKAAFEGRIKLEDERFARDKERIEHLENLCDDLQKLSTQMGELLKKYDEQIETQNKRLEEQSKRLDDIERKPGRRWEKLVLGILGAIGSAAGGAILTLMAQNM